MTPETNRMIATADESIRRIEKYVWDQEQFSTLRSSGQPILSSARESTISTAAVAALIMEELEWFIDLYVAQTDKSLLCMNWLLILLNLEIRLNKLP